MREMVFRERTEKIAHVRAIAAIVAHVVGADVDRVFGGIVSDYASEVFQESYDPTLLRRKAERLRAAQARVRKRREEDLRMIERLDKLGEYYDLAEEAKKSK